MADEESVTRRPGFAETLREGWKPARRRSKTGSSEARTAEAPAAAESAKPTEEVPAAKSTNGAETQSPAAAAGTAAPAGTTSPDPNLSERIEGLQGWMAEIERKQRRMTLISTVGTLLALLAAGAALYFAVTTPNSATKDDFDNLENQVETLQGQVTRATTDQARLKELNASVEALTGRLGQIELKQNQQASEIAAVKAQAQAAQQAAATATPTPTPTPTPVTPPAGNTKP
jgi:hypothetical protein